MTVIRMLGALARRALYGLLRGSASWVGAKACAIGLNVRFGTPDQYVKALASDMDKVRRIAASASISLD